MKKVIVTIFILVVASAILIAYWLNIPVNASRIKMIEGVAYIDGESERFTGEAVLYWPNGQPRYQATFQNGYEFGGTKEWYENGQLSSWVGFGALGKRHGYVMSWYESGQKKWEQEYEEGLPLGSAMNWSVAGELLEELIGEDVSDNVSLQDISDLELGFYGVNEQTNSGTKRLEHLQSKADRVIWYNLKKIFDLGIGVISDESRTPVTFSFKQIESFLKSEKHKGLLVIQFDKTVMWNEKNIIEEHVKEVLALMKRVGYQRVVILGAHAEGIHYVADTDKIIGSKLPKRYLVFTGTVSEITISSLPRSRKNFIVTMRVEKVIEGTFSGKTFSFRIHSPSQSGLTKGLRYKIRAEQVEGGYIVRQLRFNPQ